MTVPMITLNDGVEIPQLGFGTMNLAAVRDDSPASHETTAQGVEAAIAAGYRHFDTAQMYANEKGLGLGIERSGVPREAFFLTSKLGNGSHRPDDVRRSFEQTLRNLNVDRLDLFLMHWPTPTLYGGDYVSTWRAMTDLVDEGLLRSAGVSNFNADHLRRIIEETGRVPSVDQVEVYPYFANRTTADACAGHGVAVEAWSPLGQATILDDPTIGEIARAHDRTPADAVLRWHLQQGRIVIPKTATPARMAQNIAVFDFELAPAELAAIDALDRGEVGRRGPDPDTFDWVPTSARPQR
ncbi:aldo/keto reductase [Gordonia hydrophobica]|uniref:Aldo/keto reductase n=1 Tax=Gordonia hydrophobica TaxID=40516 RepID=A0ABZ2TXF8_9ACTN|nr:aldo/keto reductase [Gordonia hydrophobica]MBM7366370.1 2,5-diketo-D-gluconate reductase A [Gordonia hydrophobica]